MSFAAETAISMLEFDPEIQSNGAGSLAPVVTFQMFYLFELRPLQPSTLNQVDHVPDVSS